MQAEKWLVGDEYDEVVFARLMRALSDLQYAVRDQWGALAGSQDMQQGTAAGPGGQLKSLTVGTAHPAGPHAVDTLILAVLKRQGSEWRIKALENVTLTNPRTGENVLRDV
jgi:hypothetical protein